MGGRGASSSLGGLGAGWKTRSSNALSQMKNDLQDSKTKFSTLRKLKETDNEQYQKLKAENDKKNEQIDKIDAELKKRREYMAQATKHEDAITDEINRLSRANQGTSGYWKAVDERLDATMKNKGATAKEIAKDRSTRRKIRKEAQAQREKEITKLQAERAKLKADREKNGGKWWNGD